MRVAIDTNVLVRYLTWDDEKQARVAAALIESAEAVMLSTIVLCETVWVLRRAYKHGAGEVAATLARVITARGVEVDRPAAEAGLASLRQGCDFADGVILHEASAADQFATFDEGFTRKNPSKVRILKAKP